MNTRFMGYTIKGSLIAASSPLTESLAHVIYCVENGAAAVILKTATSSRIDGGGGRHCFINRTGFWAKSSFRREMLSLDEGIQLTREAVDAVAVPVLASVTELSLDLEQWLTDCMELEKAGAAGIQLDLFYLKNLLAMPDFENKFVRLLTTIIAQCRIPVMPKLNIGIPVEYAVYLLQKAGVHYVSALDSINSPAPVLFDEKGVHTDSVFLGSGLSVFGNFMLPLTRQYTFRLSQSGFEVCAGGGVVCAHDVIDLLLLGADTVQLATEALLKGYHRFSEIDYETDKLLAVLGIGSPELLKEKSESLYSRQDKQELETRTVIYTPEQCCGCHACTSQAFCSHIQADDGRISISGCEGCGLCAALCPNGALQVSREK